MSRGRLGSERSVLRNVRRRSVILMHTDVMSKGKSRERRLAAAAVSAERKRLHKLAARHRDLMNILMRTICGTSAACAPEGF